MEEVFVYSGSLLGDLAGVEVSVAEGTTCRQLLSNLAADYAGGRKVAWELVEDWNGCSKLGGGLIPRGYGKYIYVLVKIK